MNSLFYIFSALGGVLIGWLLNTIATTDNCHCDTCTCEVE